MFVCPNCGRTYEKKYAFCESCGTRLEERTDSSSQVQEAPVSNQQGTYQQPQFQQEQNQQEQNQQGIYQQPQNQQGAYQQPQFQQTGQMPNQQWNPSAGMGNMQVQPPKKSSKTWIIIVIVLVVVLAAGGVAAWYFFYQKDRDDKSDRDRSSRTERDRDDKDDKSETEDKKSEKDSKEADELEIEDYVAIADDYFKDEEYLDGYSTDMYQISDGIGLASWDIPNGIMTKVVDDFDGDDEVECLAITCESGDIYANMYSFDEDTLKEQSAVKIGMDGNLAQYYGVVYLNSMKKGINISFEVEEYTTVEMADGLNRVFVNLTYENGKLKKQTDYEGSGSDWDGILTPAVAVWNLNTDEYYYYDMIYNANKSRAIAICEINGKVDSAYENDYGVISEFVAAGNGSKKKCGSRSITDGAPDGKVNLSRKNNSEPVTATKPPEEPVQTVAPAVSEYVIWDSSSRYLTEADLAGLSKEQLRIARNEIYARHGRMFQDSALQDYFNSKSWYVGTIPADAFQQDMLSEIEKANTLLISEYEKKLP